MLPSLHYKMYVQVMGGDTAATPTFIHFFLVCICRMLNRRKLKHKNTRVEKFTALAWAWMPSSCHSPACWVLLLLLLLTNTNQSASHSQLTLIAILIPHRRALIPSIPVTPLPRIGCNAQVYIRYICPDTPPHSHIANTTTTVQYAHNIERLPSYF